MDGGETGRTRQSSALWRSFRNGDFAEEDVWNVLTEESATASKSDVDSNFFARSSVVDSIGSKSAPRSIPRRLEPKGSKSERRFGSERDEYTSDGGDDEDEDGSDYRAPPHELIAKRLARAQISSFSVVEGVGRTLKGRDLSEVRNAVLIKTGFLELC